METVEHDGRETAYVRTRLDDGPAVCYVHGSGADHQVWATQYAPDGPAHPAVALDLSGHGESDDVDTDHGSQTLAAYAEDVVAVAEETEADVLVGNSLGGAVVLHAVLEQYVEPTALVLAGTGAKLAVDEHLRELLADDFESAVDVLHGDDALFHDADGRTIERSKAVMRTVGQRVTRRDFLTCHRFDVRDRLSEIDVPTLALCGERDRLTPPKYHEFLADGVRDGRFEKIPNAAHLAMVEHSDAFDDRVKAFLDSVDVV